MAARKTAPSVTRRATLRNVLRVVRTYLPTAVVVEREMIPGLRGLSSYDDVPVIMYASGLSRAERNHAILHELAHCLFDRDIEAHPHGLDHQLASHRYNEREARADTFAEETLARLEHAIKSVWDLPRNDVAACLAFVRARRGRVSEDDYEVMLMLQDDWTELRGELRRAATRRASRASRRSVAARSRRDRTAR